MRNWIWALLGVAIWLVAARVNDGPAPRDMDAPASQFSATRAAGVLARLEASGRPHPAGSREDAAVHDRLLKELAAMAVPVQTLSARQCYSEPRWAAIECADITDVIATIVPGDGKAVVLMAHMDSVPAGPGAGDDGSGVATLLETIRALKAQPARSRHPVIALFTDGEEAGLLGAKAFVDDPDWRGRVGVTINVESRGSSGQSLLFQTSPGDARLIDLYAANAPRYATSSLYDEIYRFLPNDTDLTPFLQAGLTGYNFAFVGTVAHYHTALDTIANLDPRSLQSSGDAVLGLVRGLMDRDFAALKSGNAIYLDLFGALLPRLPMFFALPLSLLILAVILFMTWQQRPGWRSFLAPPLFVIAAVLLGFGLKALAAAISGHADPAYAQPLVLRISLALGVWALALFAARRAHIMACWMWFALFAVASAAFIPGISPYFLFPGLIAALTLPFGLAWAPAIASMLIWLQFTAEAEPLMGLDVTPLFMLPAALGLLTVLPLLKTRPWQAILCACLSALFAVGAGFVPPYDARHPQRLDFRYVESEGRAFWLADPVMPLPQTVRAAMMFSKIPQPVGDFDRKGYVASAGKPLFPFPSATVRRDGPDVMLNLAGSSVADGMVLTIPVEAGLVSVALDGKTFPIQSGRRALQISCASPGCRNATLTLKQAEAKPFDLQLTELRYGLPASGVKLLQARAPLGVASQFGDGVELMTRIRVD